MRLIILCPEGVNEIYVIGIEDSGSSHVRDLPKPRSRRKPRNRNKGFKELVEAYSEVGK